MRFYHISGLTAIGAMLAGLHGGCSNPEQTQTQTNAPVPTSDEPPDDFGLIEQAAGLSVPNCVSATTSGGTPVFNTTKGILTIDLARGTGGNPSVVVISAPSGILKMNGSTCYNTTATTPTALVTNATTNTAAAVKMIYVKNVPDNGKVLVDLYGSTFSNMWAAATNVGFDVDLTSQYGNVDGTLLLRGGTQDDKFTVSKGTLSGTNYHFIDYGATGTPTLDAKADFRVKGGNTTVAGATGMALSLGAGNDIFTTTLNYNATFGTAAITAITGNSVAADISLLVYGGAGNDLISDGNNGDVIYGGAGNDTIRAVGAGDMTVTGGTQVVDMYFGGSDNADVIDYSSRSAGLTIFIDDGTKTLASGQGAMSGHLAETDYVINDIEVVYGGTGNDSITGTSLADVFHGGLGNDTLVGTLGNDLLYGEAGNDRFVADAADTSDGDDTLVGGTGTDIADYSFRSASMSLTINAAADLLGTINGLVGTTEQDVIGTSVGDVEILYGGTGSDSIVGSAGNDAIFGSHETCIASDTVLLGVAGDVILGAGGDDMLYASECGDSIRGGNGLDWIFDGAGADYLMGDANDDHIFSTAGTDTLVGGSYADIAGPLEDTTVGTGDTGAGVNSLYSAGPGGADMHGADSDDCQHMGTLADNNFGGCVQ